MPERTERLELYKSKGFYPANIELVIGDGPDKGRKFTLKKKSLIGSHSSCDIKLIDKYISKKHVELEVEKDRISIKDLKSTNGTFIGSQSVKCGNISFYESIRIGKTIFSVIPKQTERNFVSCALLKSRNAEMKILFKQISSVADTKETILIHGETGTGKELVAKSIHLLSKYKESPFIAVNCGALAPELIESELFGHIRGAFTGAEKFREGAFLAAKDGTLFLDEIGELPLNLQPKLLRALENREIKTVGSDIPKSVNCHVIAATHRNLLELTKKNKFREDLYYRLNILPLNLPSLRDRKEDIPLLINQFLSEFNGTITQEAIKILTEYEWPGNVRELKNVLIRTFHLSTNNKINVADLLFNTNISTNLKIEPILESGFKSLHDIELFTIKKVLKEQQGNRSKSAKILGISKSTLLQKIKKYSIVV